MRLSSYRQLKVWQKAIDLVEGTYRLTRAFPPEERFGLTTQMQRAAVSVPANIAEGYGRLHRGDYVHHLSMARGSLMELETHLTIAARLKLVPRNQVLVVWQVAQEVGRMLNSMVVSLRKEGRVARPDSESGLEGQDEEGEQLFTEP